MKNPISVIRLGGVCCIIAATVHCIGWLLSFKAVPDEYDILVVSCRFVGHVILQFAVIALFAHQIRKIGIAGLIGFLAILVGNAMLTGVEMIEAYVGPALERHLGPENVGFLAEDATVGIVLATGPLLFILGWVTFSISTSRSGSLPSVPTFGVAVGMIALLMGIAGVSTLVGVVGSILFAGGFIWLGYFLWKDTGPTRMNASLASV